ncbi:hypothetical protein QBC35DRAFT_486693 [Podospora australis]|uniref:Rhomboid family membrane protein n=1 Tax=Podospora australis TaxID=1536484 RepID=A0AAN6X081_9PEZI|nr:hypothetical protein QBC35DRAFT_486693 [Podospora australis]
MSSPNPSSAPAAPSAPAQPQPQVPYNGVHPILHYASWGAAILAPIALFIPARRTRSSTLQNAVIVSGGFWAFNNLALSYTGKSIVERSNERWGKIFKSISGSELPEKAQRNKQLMEAERKRRAEAAGQEYIPKDQQRTALQKLWLGDEKDDWKTRRMAEEKKALDEGKGYGDLIMEQIGEVFGSSKKGEEASKKDGEEPKKKD